MVILRSIASYLRSPLPPHAIVRELPIKAICVAEVRRLERVVEASGPRMKSYEGGLASHLLCLWTSSMCYLSVRHIHRLYFNEQELITFLSASSLAKKCQLPSEAFPTSAVLHAASTTSTGVSVREVGILSRRKWSCSCELAGSSHPFLAASSIAERIAHQTAKLLHVVQYVEAYPAYRVQTLTNFTSTPSQTKLAAFSTLGVPW